MGMNPDGSWTPTADDPLVRALAGIAPPLNQSSPLEIDDRAEHLYHHDARFHAQVEMAVQTTLAALDRRRLHKPWPDEEKIERNAMRRAVAVALLMAGQEMLP